MMNVLRMFVAYIFVLAGFALPLSGFANGEQMSCGVPDNNEGGGGGGSVNSSHDPNEMAGPVGIGEQRYVKPGETMDYTIYFENDTNATAAAINITVTLPKDANLDWSTLELGEVVFGDHTDTGFVDDKTARSIKYALADSGCEIRTAVTETDSDITWNLRIWDPTTADHFPDDFSKGVLPPNDPETHCGEGYISFRVKVKDDAATGSKINASASIVFDDNPAIITDPAWWNTVGSPGAAFAESEVTANEGEMVEVRVMGGGADAAASVKVHLTYNTAAAADIDLTKGEIDGETPKGGLKFPLTLTWAKGEIGEKVISIPVKTDKTVEGDEFFTLQLAEAEGMELGEERVCTVTIRDMNDKTLKTTVTPYKPKKNEMVATNSVTVASGNAKGGFVSGAGEYTAGSKLTLTAEARPGWAFVGWATRSAQDILSNKTKWQIVVTNDEDYVAVFEKIPYVRGLADPADGGKVSGSALCPAGKKVTLKTTTNKNFTFVGWTTNAARSVIAPYQDGDFVATTASLVIDRSAKPAANSKTSTTITETDGDVTYYAVFKSDPEIFVTVDAPDEKGAEPTGKGFGKYVAGTITGMGKYAPGKTKIALKAAANKGYVFAGWFDAGSGLLTKNATYTVASMGENDVEYTARFVTADEDKASIALGVNGEEMAAAGAGRPPYRTNIWAGVYLEWPVAASALSETKVKVAGLPSGLKFTDKPVTSKIGSGKTAVVVTNVLANTIYGAPTAASKKGKDGNPTPSAVKITVTTAGKSTQTYQIDMTVDALPNWAVGTFDGAVQTGTTDVSPVGTVSLTIAANGKISGKILEGGKTWTLSAAWFEEVECPSSNVDESIFRATVVGKAGKEEITNEVTVAAGVVRLGEDASPHLVGVVSGATVGRAVLPGEPLSWSAYQNLWKRADTKAAQPVFKKNIDKVLGNGLKLIFKKDGVVSFAGKLDGTSVSGSSQLVSNGEKWQVTLYAPQKGTFKGYNETIAVTLTLDAQNVVTAVYVVGGFGKVQLWEGGPYWATMNIGAEKPEDYGYYFWWGDTVGYKLENTHWVAVDGSSFNFAFEYENTPTCHKSVTTLQREEWITTDGVLAPEHDAAQVQWGGGWRMPTDQELYDLCYVKCIWTWTTMNDVKGYIVCGRGDYASNSIFLPAAGGVDGTSLHDAGSQGYAACGLYWSSVPYKDDYHSWYLEFITPNYISRCEGLPIRPVQSAAE